MRFTRALAALAAGAFLVTGFDAATYAATGQSLILGQVNNAGRTTTIDNTGSGPALKLLTDGGAPPLSVNSQGRVRKLNSDLVDGWQGSAMLNRATVLTDNEIGVDVRFVDWSLDAVPAGRYLVTWNAEFAAMSEGDVVGCAIRSNDGLYPEQLGASSSYFGPYPAWVGSAGVVDLDPGTMYFGCKFYGGSGPWYLTSPLTIAFQPIAVAQDLPLGHR